MRPWLAIADGLACQIAQDLAAPLVEAERSGRALEANCLKVPQESVDTVGPWTRATPDRAVDKNGTAKVSAGKSLFHAGHCAGGSSSTGRCRNRRHVERAQSGSEVRGFPTLLGERHSAARRTDSQHRPLTRSVLTLASPPRYWRLDFDRDRRTGEGPVAEFAVAAVVPSSRPNPT